MGRDRRLSPSLVIAFLALLISLGGTGYAAVKLPKNSVGTTQLKGNSVTGAKVKDASLFRNDFAPDQLPMGPQGPKGDPGVPGERGPTGAAGRFSSVTVRYGQPIALNATTTNNARDAWVMCEPGEIAIAGGGDTRDRTGGVHPSGEWNSFLDDSFPIRANSEPAATSDVPVGWRVGATNLSAFVGDPQATAELVAYAICAR